jgi:hypothetical protein
MAIDWDALKKLRADEKKEPVEVTPAEAEKKKQAAKEYQHKYYLEVTKPKRQKAKEGKKR